jgi:hypothetical protein
MNNKKIAKNTLPLREWKFAGTTFRNRNISVFERGTVTNLHTTRGIFHCTPIVMTLFQLLGCNETYHGDVSNKAKKQSISGI